MAVDGAVNEGIIKAAETTLFEHPLPFCFSLPSMILAGLIVAALASLAHGASAEKGHDDHGHKYDLLDRCHPFPNISLLTMISLVLC